MTQTLPNDPAGAFCPWVRLDRQDRADGTLAGLRFAVKDLFDVAGVPTGAGSPDWLATHAVPQATAPAVARLLAAGARLVGKTVTDEMAWSLAGQNAHYGTPLNAAAPERIPGGSSCGSAAAVAAGAVAFALGSDTGGSVRLPASFCGLFGMRPTHGRIPLDGAVKLAPSYDTAGWFARDGAMLARVGRVLLDDAAPAVPAVPVGRLRIAADLFATLAPPARAALAPGVADLERRFGTAEAVTLAGDDLPQWRETFRIVQSAEAWAAHGDWVREAAPAFGPGVRERFEAASRLAPVEVAQARAARVVIRARMRALVPAGTLLLVPGAPGAAPRREAAAAELDAMRRDAIGLMCAAGHAGLPQLAIPSGTVEGAPLGLGLIGWEGGDTSLLKLAAAIAP